MALLAKVLIRNSLPLTPKTSNVYNNLLRRSLRQSKGALLCAQKNERSDQDRILTVPNLLCIGRIAVSPYLATSIINGDLKTSLAIFGFAGFTDLVSVDIRLGKTGSLGPWSRVMVCCSKLCFCQNEGSF